MKTAAVLLAAGLSTRMENANKLLLHVDGKTMIRQSADAALKSKAEPVIVVTGHDAPLIRDALKGTGALFAHAADYAAGLSASLAAGISALPNSSAGAGIALADMPFLTPTDWNRVIQAFEQAGAERISAPVKNKRRGHPVIFPRAFFPSLSQLTGDKGAESLIEKNISLFLPVPFENNRVFRDIDTLQELRRRGTSESTGPISS